ncbi:MAG: hypothetical protein GX640_02675 [Fibrobacter sp.]|nr:hypothetical protein [Fibrobacter sp.]
MPIYKTKRNDDLRTIASIFKLPSWKYLYQINRRIIGDNPDLLPEGIDLEIPEWDSTSGDEKIREKGVSPFQYTGGLRYAYPWNPVSITLTDSDGNQIEDFQESRPFKVFSRHTGEVIIEGQIQSANEFRVLLPGDENDFEFGIKDLPLKIKGELHLYRENEQ